MLREHGRGGGGCIVGNSLGCPAPQRNPSNTSQVAVFFPNGTLASVTGGSVLASAVQRATGTAAPTQAQP